MWYNIFQTSTQESITQNQIEAFKKTNLKIKYF